MSTGISIRGNCQTEIASGRYSRAMMPPPFAFHPVPKVLFKPSTTQPVLLSGVTVQLRFENAPRMFIPADCAVAMLEKLVTERFLFVCRTYLSVVARFM